MIKNIIAVLILLFMMIIQYQSYAKPAQPQVKGGFKSCNAFDYKYKSGKIDKKSEVKSYTQNYDEKGNVIEIISFEKNKISQKNKIENKYNDKDLLVETVYLDEAGKAVMRYAYIYDAKLNKIADRTFNNAGKETANTIYKYDNNDFLIEAVYNIINDNKVENTSSIAFKNDNYGNKIEEYSNHSSDISISVTSEYKLDNSSSKSEMNTEQSVKDGKSAPDKITYTITSSKFVILAKS